MADQGERGWRASVTSNGRGLTGVSPRPGRSTVSDSFRQIPSKSGLFRLSGTVNWSASTYLAIAAEADRQLIRKVTVSCRSGSALSTRSGSNDRTSGDICTGNTWRRRAGAGVASGGGLSRSSSAWSPAQHGTLSKFGGRFQPTSHLTSGSNGNRPLSRVFNQWQRCRVGGSPPPTSTASSHRNVTASANPNYIEHFGGEPTCQQWSAGDAL